VRLEGGYFHSILDIDLSAGASRVLRFGDQFALKYLGGRGFGAKLLWDNVSKPTDPLSPDNVVVIAPGPLTGLYLPASGKTSFVSLSPATGIYGDSNAGAQLGIELRQAGYDAMIIRGKAPALSYIWIGNDSVEIVPDEELKGKTCLETEGIIRGRLGDQTVKIASIGVAGENLVRFACITADWGRNAGRTGMGAVLGSKNVKAIVVRGSRDLPVYDVAGLRKLSDAAFAELRRNPYFEFWQQQGLMSVVDYLNSAGVLPSYNFRDGTFAGADAINGYEMEANYKIGDTACFACPMCCGKVNLVKEGKYTGAVVEGPEYETACMFGSNLGVSNFGFLVKANVLCDELGIDTISTGNLIGALIEGYQTGLLKPGDVDGLQLRWGDEETIIALVNKIAHREGAGDTLADGARAVLDRWPQLTPVLSHVKGLEQSAYDGRAALSMALAYGTSDIGAHHARAWTIAKELEMGSDWGIEEKVDLVIYHQSVRPLFDMLGVCRLPWIELGFSEDHYVEFYHAVTGVRVSIEQMLERSRAIYDLTRVINAERGATRQDDYPPPRCFELPVQTGPHKGDVVDPEQYEDALQLYYKKRGWDDDGNPPDSTKELFNDPLE